jgi:hypothetical protein
MNKILDDIDITLVEDYLIKISENTQHSEKTGAEIQSILEFLDWAYEKNYISFFKYQQTKDLLDNSKNNRLSEQSKNVYSSKVFHRAQDVQSPPISKQPERHFLVKHAYIFFPIVTGAIVLILYIFIQSSNTTISPIQIGSLNSMQRQSTSSLSSNMSYILNYQDELKDEFGIPLKEATSLRFRLYQGPNTTEAVYDSATSADCLIKPLIDGAVQIDIGKACGEPIPGSIFASNSGKLWLGVTIASAEEVQPRKLVTLTAQGLSIDTLASQNETGTAENDLLNDVKLSSNGTDTIIQSTNSAHIRLLSGSTQVMDISPNGNVGINKDNPQSKLDIGGSVNISEGELAVSDDQTSSTSVKIENKNKSENADGAEIKLGYEGKGSNGNSYLIFKNGISRIQGRIHSNQNGGVSYTTSGSDFAEFFRKDLTTSYNNNSFSPGTLICHSSEGVSPCNTSSQYIVGAISDNPGFIGGAELTNNENYALVGLVGQLNVKVYNDGTIKPGDALTLSTYPGYGSKAYQKGYILGYALETPSKKGLTTVKAHIQPSFYDPILYSGISGQDNQSYLAEVSTHVKTLIADLIEATTAKVETLLAKKVSTDTLVAKTIEAPQISKIEDNVNKLNDRTKINTFIASNGNGAVDENLKENITTSAQTAAKKTSIQTNSSDAGEGFIKAGQKSVVIYNKNVQPQTLVYLTSTSPSQNSTIYIAEKHGCASKNVEQSGTSTTMNGGEKSEATNEGKTCQAYFKVSIDKPLDSDITFNWWVVNE